VTWLEIGPSDESAILVIFAEVAVTANAADFEPSTCCVLGWIFTLAAAQSPPDPATFSKPNTRV